MSCSNPVTFEELVRYWAEDLTASELDRIDEHLLGCEVCSRESARLSALVESLRTFVPPVLKRAKVEQLRARGLKIAENTFAPGQRQSVVFSPDLDLLVHRLAGFDLSNVDRVHLTVRVESTGQVLLEDPNAPFDAHEGVLIACQRHYATAPPDTQFELRAFGPSGTERTAIYSIPHVFP